MMNAMGATRRQGRGKSRDADQSGADNTLCSGLDAIVRAGSSVLTFPFKALGCAYRGVTAPVRRIQEVRAQRSESKAAKAARLASERFARMAPWEQDEVNRTRRRLDR